MTQATHVGTGRSTGRVLVADDASVNRQLLRELLEAYGHEIEEAADGIEALERVCSFRPDAVLLDVNMPRMDGFEVCRRLKADPTTSAIPVLLVTALSDKENRLQGISVGANDYITKPIDTAETSLRVRNAVAARRLHAEVEEQYANLVEYMREVTCVAEAAEALESRRYTPGSLASVAVRSDQLGRLARVFDKMATEVRVREEQLESQIGALRAEMVAHPRPPEWVAAMADSVTRHLSGTVSIPPMHGEDDAAHGLRPGSTFGKRFEIQAELGGGGMGVVFRAWDRELEELVGIKILRPSLQLEESAIERFKSEIRLARQIASPHVVRTHDFGVADGLYFLTMEYVEGITLRDLLIQRAVLAVPATLAIATQLARALEVAHGQGVIHRDIKPENLLLDARGMLRVMDFGVARMVEHSKLRTQQGAIVGTPAYMSPEQLAGDPVDARTDLYGFGVVLYECLTGRRPIDAEGVYQLIAKVLQERPAPPATLNPEIPAALSALVMRLLSKHRQDRPQSAGQVCDLLAAVS
jgi:CheY-like chemotaxis protein